MQSNPGFSSMTPGYPQFPPGAMPQAAAPKAPDGKIILQNESKLKFS